MRIETKNLILRNYKLIDLQDYCNLMKQQKVANRAGFNVVNDDNVALSKLKYYMKEPFYFAIELKDTGRVVGEIGLNMLSSYTNNIYELNQNDRAKEFEYSLSEEYWGKGILSEALPAVVKLGMENLDLDYMVGACFLPNSASKKVMLKSGLIPYKMEKNHTWRETGEKCKIVLCKISKEQYKHISWYKDLDVKIDMEENNVMKNKNIDEINISDFIFRRGICNALSNVGISTLGDLVYYREDYIKNILYSNRDFEHLKEKIKDYNQQMRGARVEEDETPITRDMFSDRVYKALVYNGGIKAVQDIMVVGSAGLSYLHNIGKEELKEIKTRLMEMGFIKKLKSEQSEK